MMPKASRVILGATIAAIALLPCKSVREELRYENLPKYQSLGQVVEKAMLAPFGFLGSGGLTVNVTSNTANVDLHSLAVSAGYTGGNCTILISSGTSIYSTSAASPALVPGSWPAGVTVTLIIDTGAYVSGCGGGGGTGSGTGGGASAGAGGGTAIDATAVSGFTFKINNKNVIRGGGGGGGGGGAATYCGGYVAGGGGGGGGAGHNGGGGGGGGGSFSIVCGGYASGSSGSSGSTGGGGAGGGGGYANVPGCPFGFNINGDTGGAGGGFGAAGSAGAGAGAGGGAAGKAVNGDSHITWIATGTRTGPVV